jgi:hypothetical protein
MKCSTCASEAATVHITHKSGGNFLAIHLCQACAVKMRVNDPAGFSLADLLSAVRAAQETAQKGRTSTMTFMFEVYYRPPEDADREARISSLVNAAGGRLDFREPAPETGGPICLTFEFENRAQAESAAEALRKSGEHVEGVSDYG